MTKPLFVCDGEVIDIEDVPDSVLGQGMHSACEMLNTFSSELIKMAREARRRGKMTDVQLANLLSHLPPEFDLSKVGRTGDPVEPAAPQPAGGKSWLN